MKSLVFSHTPTWPSHHAESVEIALTEHELGNDVVYLSCVGSLKTCPAYAVPSNEKCKICRSQTEYTKSKILPSDIKFLDLDLKKTGYSYQIFNSIYDLKIFEINKIPFGRMVFSTLTSEFNDSFFDVNEQKDRINTLIENAVGLYEYGLKIIQENEIDQVYVWNGRRSCDGPLLYAARTLGVKYSAFISGGKFNSLLIRHEALIVQDVPAAKIELLEVVNNIEQDKDRFNITKGAINYFNYSSGNSGSNAVNHMGFYQFSKKFEKKQKNIKEFSEKRKIIAVFTGTYSEYAGVPGYDNPDNFCNDFYEGVSFLQENFHRINNAELRIRWHPNSRNLKGNEYEKLLSIIERGKEIINVHHIYPESNYNTYDLIEAADKCIGFGTSVSVETCLYGKPTIFIGNNMFEDLDCFYKPSSYEELIEILNSELEIKSFDHALAWGYYFSNFGTAMFSQLHQKKIGMFYYKGIRLANFRFTIRLVLGRIKRTLLGLLN